MLCSTVTTSVPTFVNVTTSTWGTVHTLIGNITNQLLAHSYVAQFDFTGKSYLLRCITRREAAFGTVIHSIFDAWRYKVIWTCAWTILLWSGCNYVRLILYIMLHSTNLKPNCQIHFFACCQVHSEVHCWLHSIVHSLPAWLTLSRGTQVHPSMLPSTPPSTFSSTLSGILSRMLSLALDGRLPACLTVRSQALKMLSSTLLGTLSSTLPIAPDDTLPACLTIRSQVSSQDTLKHTPEHSLKNTPNCTRWHTPSLLDCMLPSKLSRCSQVHSRALSRTHPIALDDTLPACLTVRSHVSSQDTTKYTSESLLNTLQIALNGTLPAYWALCYQVHCQEGRHSQSHLTICSHVCSCMLHPETCWVAEARRREASVAGARHREAWGRWGKVGSVWRAAHGMWCMADGRGHIVAKIMTFVDIIVWTLSLAYPPWQDLMIPHGHGVDNRCLWSHRKGRQFELGESRSPTQSSQRNLVPTSDQLWAYVCPFGLVRIEMMAMAMAMAMAMVMVLVIVIIVPEVLRQVGWLCQRQHQSFHRLRAFY